MASPPRSSLPDAALSALSRMWAAVRSWITRNRTSAGILGGAAALVLATFALLPSMASANVAPAPSSTASASAAATGGPGVTATADDAAAAPAAPVKPPHKPVPASATHKARFVPDYPRDHKHHGKRIVYDKALMTVWLIDKNDQVLYRFPVVGRFDRPAKGVYHVFSKSPVANNPFSKVTFNHMVRFAYGPDTTSPIGLHAIPRYYDGTPMHSVKQLGLAIARGGCVRLSEKAAAIVYRFMHVGDRVVVLPSP